jgi:Skp family chaperone for outer membrane proteins
MRKILLILCLFISSAYICTAQDGKDDIYAVKIAYITDQLKLTTEEAQKFWPIYNRYFDEVKKAQQNTPDDVVAFQEKLVNIRKKYKKGFKDILGSDDRANKVYIVEAKFIALLQKERQRRENE